MNIKNNSRKIGLGSILLILVINIILMWILMSILGIDVTAQFTNILAGTAENELTNLSIILSAIISGILSANLTGLIIDDEQ